MIAEQATLQRVLVLADESAGWRVAGLTQLHRILLSLNEYAESSGQRVPISVCVRWKEQRNDAEIAAAEDPRLVHLEVNHCDSQCAEVTKNFDLMLGTRVFLYRNAIAELVGSVTPTERIGGAEPWDAQLTRISETLGAAAERRSEQVWRWLATPAQIPHCEREFLRHAGKSQDGLISRHLNRPISRFLTRSLLKTPITPSTWSVLIFLLPLAACAAFLQGTPTWFVVGCAIFQLYSILDGCDGEIARAKFLQTEFGRRLDSLLDLSGNMLLAASLGIGLARHALPATSLSWLYLFEGMAAATCVVLSEGIVFLRRSRRQQHRGTTALNGALYHRHHEFFQRSGILVFGENVAWWIVFMTKRDMAMLAFLVLAIVGQPEWILHLLLGVGAINSALAGNAFFRAPAPALQHEAS